MNHPPVPRTSGSGWVAGEDDRHIASFSSASTDLPYLSRQQWQSSDSVSTLSVSLDSSTFHKPPKPQLPAREFRSFDELYRKQADLVERSRQSQWLKRQPDTQHVLRLPKHQKAKEINDALRSGVKVKDRRSWFRTYKQCFVGSEAVDLLVCSGLALSRTEAVRTIRALTNDYDILEPVTRYRSFEDENRFYRFKKGIFEEKKYSTHNSSPDRMRGQSSSPHNFFHNETELPLAGKDRVGGGANKIETHDSIANASISHRRVSAPRRGNRNK